MTTFLLSPENPKVEKNLMAYLANLPMKKWEVIIRVPKKSNAQERYWHMLLKVIADYMGEDLEEFKLKMKFEWLPLRTIKVKGTEFLYPVSTTTLNKEQYSMLIEKTLTLGVSLGLEMPLASFWGIE